ncbi:hypothetical protein MRBLRC7O_000881 [Agrobacterium radiobacter]|uniref:hypothetical protein n=1 Tax=Agrobacterium radiobacter TaxID=362 RepID=UPI0034673052
MAYEKRDMSGTLFKNDRREKDSHPNATGTAIIDGVEYWVSAWTKDGQKGKFQSLSFKRKDERKQEIQQSYGEASGRDKDSYGNLHDDLNDDLPF